LQAAQNQLPPFELVLGGIRSFMPINRVIYLHVAPKEELLAVRHTLLQALGADKHQYFVPHLTLTMRLSEGGTQSLLAQLQQSEWHTESWSVPMDHLWLMQRGPSDPAWRYIQRADLAGRS
jgi:2'-5' RNA ligase